MNLCRPNLDWIFADRISTESLLCESQVNLCPMNLEWIFAGCKTAGASHELQNCWRLTRTAKMLAPHTICKFAGASHRLQNCWRLTRWKISMQKCWRLTRCKIALKIHTVKIRSRFGRQRFIRQKGKFWIFVFFNIFFFSWMTIFANTFHTCFTCRTPNFADFWARSDPRRSPAHAI